MFVNNWKVTRLPVLTLTEVCSNNKRNSKKRNVIDFKTGKPINYKYRDSSSNNLNDNYLKDINLFPLIVNEAGLPWYLASSYLLSRYSDADVSIETLHSQASDLSAFKNYLDNQNNIELDTFPRNRQFRVTNRYSAFLKSKITSGEIALTTGKRRMSSIISFYRWLIDEAIIECEYEPWKDREFLLSLTNKVGRQYVKKSVTTDVSIKISKSIDPFSEYIEDEGKLRPLTIKEQKYILKALGEVDNTEMSLVFFLALFTGARIQTILTLKTFVFQQSFNKNLKEVPVLVGFGTGIDNKNDKQYTLFIPRKLYDKIKIYVNSERYKKRRDISEEYSKDYLFLTNRGTPYYTLKSDREVAQSLKGLRHIKKGQAIRQFIKDSLLPVIHSKYDKNFKFRFHDLRASYGMNLTDVQLKLVEKGDITLHQARQFVKARMGHNNVATTDKYLEYRGKIKYIRKVQKDYEQHLLDLAMEANISL